MDGTFFMAPLKLQVSWSDLQRYQRHHANCADPLGWTFGTVIFSPFYLNL